MLVVRPFRWLVTNALPCPEPAGVEAATELEKHVARGFPGKVKGIIWRAAPEEAVTPFGLLDMRKAVADKTHVMAYAYTELDSGEAGVHLLDVRHDDMIRIWVNGERVFTSARCAPSDLTRRLVKVDLRKGRNHVLVKICQRRNFWEFDLRVLTAEGDPAQVTGSELSTALTSTETQN